MANASFGLGVALLTLAAPPLILCAFRLVVMLLCACCGVPVDGRVVTSQTNVRDAMLACFRPRKMLAKRGSREMWVAYRLEARPWAMTTVEVGAHHVVRCGAKTPLRVFACCGCCCRRCQFQRAELPFSCSRCMIVLYCDRLVDLISLAAFLGGCFLCSTVDESDWTLLFTPIVVTGVVLLVAFCANCCFILHQNFPDQSVAEWHLLDAEEQRQQQQEAAQDDEEDQKVAGRTVSAMSVELGL